MGSSPYFFPLLRILLYRRRDIFISKQSEICFGGFPRSANSFAHHIFMSWNPDVKIAHHLHVPLQVVYAVKWHVPCIVLIRNPLDALASLYIADERLSLTAAIKSYINFYKKILPLKEYLIIAKFEEIVNDYYDVIKRTNSKFGSNFYTEAINSRQTLATLEKLKKKNVDEQRNPLMVPAPTKEKEIAKERVKKLIEEHSLYIGAVEIYSQVIER